MRVRSDGRECTESEYERLSEPTGVSYVFPPEQFIRGVHLAVDFKSEPLPPTMAATFRAIVIEELQREGVSDAVLLAPSMWDHATRHEALFVARGSRSLALRGIESSLAALRVMIDTAPDGSRLILRPGGAHATVRDFLDANAAGAPGPLDALLGAPSVQLGHDTVAAIRVALSSTDAESDPVRPPVWIAVGERVCAYLYSEWSYDAQATTWTIRVPADTDQALLAALRDLQAPQARRRVAHVADPSFYDQPLPRRIPQLHSDLFDDWWISGWRTWEPVAESPVPTAGFDLHESAARVAGSFDVWPMWLGHHWHWHNPPFDRSITAAEATAMLVTLTSQTGIRTPRDAGRALTRFEPGELSFEDATDATLASKLPSAAALTALTTLFGAREVIRWIFGFDVRHIRTLVNLIHGVRAGVLPYLSYDDLQNLRHNVARLCEQRPWTSGDIPPHAGHLLAAQLGLHDQVQHTLQTHPTIYKTVAAQILAYGAGDRSAVMTAHRQLANRFYSGWNSTAWIAVADRDGLPDLLDWIRPDLGDFERRLEPLLRLSWPELEPHMRALLDTEARPHARRWLKRHTQA